MYTKTGHYNSLYKENICSYNIENEHGGQKHGTQNQDQNDYQPAGVHTGPGRIFEGGAAVRGQGAERQIKTGKEKDGE